MVRFIVALVAMYLSTSLSTLSAKNINVPAITNLHPSTTADQISNSLPPANNLALKMPLAFTVNAGQYDNSVHFCADFHKLAITFTKEGVGYRFTGVSPRNYTSSSTGSKNSSSANGSGDVVVQTRLVGANPHPQVAGEDELLFKNNYLVGQTPDQWKINVSNFRTVRYRQVYPGVDLRYYLTEEGLEYDFLLDPAINPSVIKIHYEGVNSI